MNIATYELPSWTTEVQSFINKTAFYTPIVWRAFNKTLTPAIISSAKGLASHWFETECLWRERVMGLAGITYNPLTAAVSAVITELTSDQAIATYSRIRHIVREAVTDAIVIGLCGVVAIVEGIELGQKVYRQVKAAYTWVDAKLNHAEPGPTILPTVEMAISLQQEESLEGVQALMAEDEEYKRQFMARLKRLDADALATVQDEGAIVQDEILQPNGLGEYVPVTGPINNPEPYNIHQDVQERLREIHAYSWCDTALEELAFASTEATTATVDGPAEDIAQSLNVPGAKGEGTRKSKANGGTRNVGAKASAPKRGRVKAAAK